MSRTAKIAVGLCLAFAALFGGGYILWDAFHAALLEHYAQAFCRKCWGMELQTERIFREGDAWIFDHPSLASSDPDNSNTIVADRIIVKDSWHLSHSQLELDINVVNPNIEIVKWDAASSSRDPSADRFNIALPDFPMIAVNGRLAVSNGKLNFHDGSDSNHRRIPFELNGQWGTSLHGQMKLKFGESQDDQLIALTLSESNDARTLNIDCRNVDCKLLSRSAEKFFKPIEDWKFTHGIVNGNLSIIIAQNSPLTIVGDLVAEDLKVNNPALQLHGDVPQVLLSIKENGSGSCELSKFANITLKQSDDIILEINDISGGIFFPTLGKTDISFHGQCRHGEHSFPLELASTALDSSGALELRISGLGKDLAMFAPAAFRKVLKSKFDNDRLTLKAGVKRIPSGINLEGAIEVFDVAQSEPEEIYFGINLMQSSASHDWADLPHWKNLDTDTMSLVMPAMAFWNDMDSSGLVIESGWFNSTDLPIEKYPFSDIKAKINFGAQQLVAENVEAFSHGIYFAGSLTIDYSRILDGYADLLVNLHTMEGKVSQFKELAAGYITTPFLLNIPLEGNFALQKDSTFVAASIQPDGIQIDAKLKGTLSDGTLTNDDEDLSLHGLSGQFAYNHKANALEFTDIQGSLKVGGPETAEEYVVAGDYVRLNSLPDRKAEFDLWIGNKSRDLVRIAGETRPLNQSGDHYVEFILDNAKSHFGDVYPEVFHLSLRDWSHVEQFRMKMNLQLNSLLQEFQKISKAGFKFASRGLLKGLNDLKSAEGQVHVDISYDDQTSQYNWEAAGQNILVGDHSANEFHLKGRKKDLTWTIDQLLLDNLSLAADLSDSDGFWKVNFLGARYGDSILAGLEGDYFPREHLFEGKVNLLNINLEKLNEFPALKSFVEKFQPKGIIHAEGNVELEFLHQRPKWRADSFLKLSLQGCEFQGIRLQDVENVDCHFVSDRGVVIQGLRSNLADASTGLSKANIYINKADYVIANHEIILDGLRLNVPAKNLTWMAGTLQKIFPEAVSAKLVELISDIKSSGSIEGTIDVTRSDQHRNVRLSLSDGKYRLLNGEHDLKNIVVKYDPFEIHLQADYLLNNSPLHFSFRTRPQTMDTAELTLSGDAGNQMVFYCQSDQNKEWMLHRVEGSVDGIFMKLSRPEHAETQKIQLNGSLELDLQQASHFLPGNIQLLTNKWGIGGAYTLNGEWALPIDKIANWKEALNFKGSIQGQNCQIKGCKLHSLMAHVDATPNKMFLKDLKVTDTAGTLESDQITLSQNDFGHWIANSDSIEVKQFRPGLLFNVDNPENNFIIRQMELKDFSGDLADTNTFIGKGRAYCANPPKREKSTPLVQVPSELMIKLGIDSSALSPVAGAIDYEMKNSKIYFIKFKDMYSAGRVSKFFLPKHSSEPSYVDFDGNLHIQVRMRQHNILYKLAELFTVSIDGTVQEPKFSLTKNEEPEDD